VDLRRQLAVLRSWAKWIVLGAIAAGGAAFALSAVLQPVYESDTRILVGQALQSSSPNVDQLQSAQNLALTYAEIARSRTILERVRAEVGIDETVEEFEQRITVATSNEQPFVDIFARAETGPLAKQIADSVATQLLAIAATVGTDDEAVRSFVEEDMAAIQTQINQLRAEIAVLVADTTRTVAQQTRLETLEDRLVDLRGTYADLLLTPTRSESNRLTVIDPANVPLEPASPRPLFNTVVAVLLGLLAVIAVAFLWEKLDDRVKTQEDVERVTGLATIGQIARMPGEGDRKPFYRLATLLYPRSPAAEAFRALRTNLEFASVDKLFRTIVITSSVPREGKTVIASNLAVAFAQSGRKVILVDADLRRPNIHEMFGLRNDRGLTDMVRSEEIRFEQVANQTEVPGLLIVTSGTPPANPAELLGSQRMQRVLERLQESAEIIVIDTAPVGAVTDAAVLAAEADATVFVIQGRRTSERVAIRGREALEKVHAHVIGAVLNDLPVRSGDATTYYSSDVMEEAPTAVALPTPATRSPRGGN
jgi:capsular exopolysaccharide synthesis family protein